MVHFTIDMWTSSEQKAAYQAIVVHFVDAETRGVAQALLSLREFKGSHNGKLQAKAFLEVVEEYDLKGKVGYFTMDNHDANDTMLDDIAKEIDGLDPVARRLRRSGHIMNLIVQTFLFRSKAKKIQEDEREGIDEAYQRLCRLSEREEGALLRRHKLPRNGGSLVFWGNSTTCAYIQGALPAFITTSRRRLAGPCRGTMTHAEFMVSPH